MAKPPEDALFTGIAGKDSDPVILDQYKLYLELTDKISERRQHANQFFLGMNTGLCALIGYFYSSDAGSELKTLAWCVPIAGVLLSYFWYRLIKSYRDLNGAKFGVIQTIEQHLPLSPYHAEWVALEEGKNPKVYTPFSHLEIWVPRCYIAMFVALTVFLGVTAFCTGATDKPKDTKNAPAQPTDTALTGPLPKSPVKKVP